MRGVFELFPVHFGDEVGLLRHFLSGTCELATSLEVERPVEQYLGKVYVGLCPVVVVIETKALGDLRRVEGANVVSLTVL